MGIQISAKPDSGFDDPLGMLKDCHRRIEHFLDIFCIVAETCAEFVPAVLKDDAGAEKADARD